MENMDVKVDIVCAVLAPQRTRENLDLVLTTFIPEFEQINRDYTFPPDDPNREFGSADEMINYFVSNPTFDMAFFWNQHHDNPDRITVGAFFTRDERLILSLTVDAITDTANKYLAKIKSLLGSEVGVIWYQEPPPFEDGADFVKKYGRKAETAEDK